MPFKVDLDLAFTELAPAKSIWSELSGLQNWTSLTLFITQTQTGLTYNISSLWKFDTIQAAITQLQKYILSANFKQLTITPTT